jgi:O-antigen ligase
MTSGEGLGSPAARGNRAGGEIAALSAAPPGSSRLFALVALATFGCLLLITLVPPGATRMYAWPWSIAYTVTLIGPALLLILRAFDRQRVLALPDRRWTATALATASVVLAAAIASPYRTSSLLWSGALLSPIAVFFVGFDWLQSSPERSSVRREQAWRVLRWTFAAIAAMSLIECVIEFRHVAVTRMLVARNGYPLGHSNYTAGLALLMLPAFAAAAWRMRGKARIGAAAATMMATAMLFTSGSRAGIGALVVLAALAVAQSNLRRSAKLGLAAGVVLVAIGFAVANPRVRAMLFPADPDGAPNLSNVQRAAMLHAGIRMGADRPVLGWGPGATPLVFPQYRAGLEGGAEDVLQLHSLPVQLWAELGGLGVVCALCGGWLVVRDRRRDPLAALTLGGYLVFALYDAQLDVPVFGFVLAGLAALVAMPAAAAGHDRTRRALGVFTFLALLAVAGFGRRDVASEWNVRALSAELGRARPTEAIALLRRSLALNPNQEIAHFNLGWLEVVSDPPDAEKHFLAAARLVPDKGGVYFGLGLARLNHGDRGGAARAWALEALNDPVFLLSPWWDNSELRPLRPAARDELNRLADVAAARLPATAWAARELRYVRALSGWLDGQLDSAAVAATADTPARRAFFSQAPSPTAIRQVGTRTLQNVRTGYPVLMRNLDLPPPVDLWVVQESAVRDSPLQYLWPDKGWLPSPIMISLLDGNEPRTR